MRLRTVYRRLICLLLLAAAGNAYSQSPQITSPFVETQWTVRDGLPINRLAEVEMLQTRDGYLWIGTRDGLVRFDGLRFTLFTTNNTPGLPSNRIRKLLETSDGSLWLTTSFGHLVRYVNRSFQLYSYADGLGERTINDLYEAPDKSLWVATSRGLSVVRGSKLIPYRPDVLNMAVTQVLVTTGGRLYAGTARKGLLRFQGNTVSRFTMQEGMASDEVTGLYEVPDGSVWIAHGAGTQALSRYVRDRITREAPMISTGDYQLYLDRWGRVWLSGGDRLMTWRNGDWKPVEPGALVRALHARADSRGLAQAGELVSSVAASTTKPVNRSTPLLRDTEGNLWLASRTDGLYRFTPALVRTVAGFEEDPNLYALHQGRDGSVWFGSLTGHLSQMLPGGRMVKYASSMGRGGMAVYEDRRGNLWAAQALCRKAATGICTSFQTIPELADTRVRAITEDRTGTLWFGTENGLYRFVPQPGATDPLEGTWRRFSRADGLSHDHVQVIHVARDGSLWLGTDGGGITRYAGGRFASITTGNGLSSNRIRSMYEDERSVLWVGTEDFGMNRIEGIGAGDLSSLRISVIREKDGLYDNGLHAIVPDRFGRLWMSTNRGLFWVERRILDAFAAGKLHHVQSTAYTTRDGMLDQEANGGSMHAAIQSRDGRLWFATQIGVAVVDPARVRPNRRPPSVIVEDAVALHEMHAIVNGILRFPRRVRDFEINYTGVSLSAPDRVRFRYRLEGFDEDWVEADRRRTAYYTNVPPGTYTFHVIAANNDGVWNEEGASIVVRVTPYYHETVWFKGLLILFIIGVLAGLYWLRHRQMLAREQELVRRVELRTHELRTEKEKTEEQARRLQELDELKSQFFTNVSHEFRTPLSLIIGPIQDLLSGRFGTLADPVTEHLRMMLRNSRRLLRMINQILDVAREESGALRPDIQPQDLRVLVSTSVKTFGAMAEHERVTLDFRCELEDDGPYIVPIDRDMIEKVVANLLSNAFKFTPVGGRVDVTLRSLPGMAEIQITDTGQGIAPDKLPRIFDRFYQVDGSTRRSHEGSGIGLSLVKAFVEAHGGTVQVRSTPGEGSTFYVRLPATLEAALPVASGDNGDAIPSEIIEMEVTATSVANTPPVTLPSEDQTTILIVDDNADMRAFLRILLESEYHVVEAGDGRDGLQLAQEVFPDLVIADVMMPHMDGLDLNRALKANADLASVPVVLLTARAGIEDQVAGLETEADAYIVKPFEPALLLAQVQSLLRIRHRLRDRLQEQPRPEEKPVVVLSAFEARLRTIIRENLTNPELDVEYLAREVALSSSQLRRRCVDELGMPPSNLIRLVRLEEAARLLQEQAGNVSEVAFAVGFESLSHFTRTFKAQYDVTPSAFASSPVANIS